MEISSVTRRRERKTVTSCAQEAAQLFDAVTARLVRMIYQRKKEVNKLYREIHGAILEDARRKRGHGKGMGNE
jgi:hypothetical protein